ncbi:WAP domain-containing protein [Trichonephila inaurata madagascariensis]|uniref:WAP domain-containing protein n=1 Tax=Trichonephila inaurata madagascariensis TaxID=2747483 RepID=A0A8X6WMF0_9ARAC|nr:WAP domain-containing protein [Trichonephila inaurata madagascariensis]
MKHFIALILTFYASAYCAIVGEFPFEAQHETENLTENISLETLNTLKEQIDLTTESTTTPSTQEPPAMMEEPAPIFKVIRDFWFQARDGLLDPSIKLAEGPVDEKTEQVIKLIEHSIIEATTILATQMANTVITTQSSVADNSKFSNRQGDVAPIEQEKVSTVPPTKSKRQTPLDLIANMSTSCSNCYNSLHSCVQQCFIKHNCNDIQREARLCPPSPNRLCNPFTPWSPVDECKSNTDCKSPLICCKDGCINKCVIGFWRP